ncbi:MAG: hypothetical protein ACHQM6_09590, partial [Candidatus Kapaibacterium sp.]
MYKKLLEDEIFMKGDSEGRARTALTILTDMLIDLNALEVFYQKPSSKELSPKEIDKLRGKIIELKAILQSTGNE